MKIAVITLGCRVNQSESAVIEGSLSKYGFEIVQPHEKPDCFIVNTCTVTGKSDAGSARAIKKALDSGSRVIVTGCYSELSLLKKAIPDERLEVVPSADKEGIISLLAGRQLQPYYDIPGRARPYLKIQDGCNLACSYCAVRLARGRSKSLSPDLVLQRASALEEAGFREIVLTGVHLGGYGRDLSPQTSLARIIKSMLRRTNIYRIRLSSININELDDELTELLADSRLCQHLHLPLQSGSDHILKLMNRTYSTGSYRRKVLQLARISPDIAFGTDVIAGFPGEENRHFIETCQLIKELPFAYLHVFPFSARKGTGAESLKPQIPAGITAQRTAALKELGRAKYSAFLSTQLDKNLAVIAEKSDDPAVSVGTTSNYLKVAIDSRRLRRGSLIFIRSVAIKQNRLCGIAIT